MLKDHPQIEQALWRTFDTTPFERLRAAEHLDGPSVLTRLDYPSYFELLEQPLPSDREAILERLAADGMISANQAGGWDVSNLGAALFAKNLGDFRSLVRKPVPVILYSGKGRLSNHARTRRAKGLLGRVRAPHSYVNALVPRNEVIGQALRTEVPMYPELAIRELVANALVHQDFSITGTGPMVEIFDDRMEVTNPGRPLVDIDRFLDTPPRSRNEALASYMRRVGICEERGSGVDKVVFQAELYQLPAPSFEVVGDSTRAVLFAHRPLTEMGHDDRVRACYLHACLRQVARDPMSNATLRQRFGIKEQNAATASRIIRETLEDAWIKPFDDAQSKRYARYLPFWA
jgi:ATP-dependent DNA helicase RecG